MDPESLDDPEGYDAARALHEALRTAGATLATAESLTGGCLGGLLTAVPGSSETYRGGVVAYAGDVKTRVLGVATGTLAEHGVVSAPCAVEMASGVRSLLAADYAVSTTGVAGPDRQEGKAVGTVFLGIVGPGRVSSTELALAGDRAAIRREVCQRALALVAAEVSASPSSRRAGHVDPR